MPRIQRGSICWHDPSPVVGHEQAKRRPWVVISPPSLLQRRLVVICAITSQPTALADPMLARWVVPFAERDVIGDMERGWVLAHHIQTRAIERFGPDDWTAVRLGHEVMARVAAAVADLAGHG